MSKIKALITMIVLGSSSVAMADSTFSASARASFNFGTPTVVVTRPAPIYQPVYQPVYQAPVVRDHRINYSFQGSHYDGRYDRRNTQYRGRPLNLTGDYSGTFGSMQLSQHGNRIVGSYVAGGGGTIEGQIMSDGTVMFNWKNYGSGPRGKGVWFLDQRSNTIQGTWGTGSSLTDGGDWDLIPLR